MADTLTITDNRTGQSFEVPIELGAVRAADLIGPFLTERGPALVLYDPGLSHTAPCRSAITNIHIEQGTLQHRGYAIEDLCEGSTFTEVAYLLLHGELPTPAQFERWRAELTSRKFVHEDVKSLLGAFQYDTPPMTILSCAVGALASTYFDAADVLDEQAREFQILRVLAKMPTLAAFSYRHRMGMPYVYPVDELSYAGNLLSMMFRMSELRYVPDPVVERALDVLLILHADHEQNASTAAVRSVGSSHVNPYAAVAAGVAALSGPSRGSADEAALTMLRRIGSPARVGEYLEQVKSGEERLMGFGHWIYKTLDPRARILRSQIEKLYEVRPRNPLLEIADELARQAAQDEYFTSRNLYPNLDLFSGLAYQAIGVPVEMFPVMFALARSAGWVAHWLEMVTDPEQPPVRPRQVYVGPAAREYVPLAQR